MGSIAFWIKRLWFLVERSRGALFAVVLVAAAIAANDDVQAHIGSLSGDPAWNRALLLGLGIVALLWIGWAMRRRQRVDRYPSRFVLLWLVLELLIVGLTGRRPSVSVPRLDVVQALDTRNLD